MYLTEPLIMSLHSIVLNNLKVFLVKVVQRETETFVFSSLNKKEKLGKMLENIQHSAACDSFVPKRVIH